MASSEFGASTSSLISWPAAFIASNWNLGMFQDSYGRGLALVEA
jgi:hypothetical protein